MARTWSVWSWNAPNRSWLEVGEGMNKSDAGDSLAAKYRACRNLGVADSAFILLPNGEKPAGTPEEMGVEVTQGRKETPETGRAAAEAGDAQMARIAGRGVDPRRVAVMSVAVGERLDLPDTTAVDILRVDSVDGRRWAMVAALPGDVYHWALYTADPQEDSGFRSYSTGSQSNVDLDPHAARNSVLRSIQRQLERSAG